jgi:hypothetical protein
MAARSWPAASTRAGSVRLTGVVSSAQRRAERRQASWALWSLNVYDNQIRSLLQTDQGYPRAGSQEFPSPTAADGSTVVYISPAQPDGVAAGNWI